MSDPGAALLLRNARLPRWLLPADWPGQGGAPALADIALAGVPELTRYLGIVL